MRSTCEIIADLKDGKEVPYEELKMACLVQSGLKADPLKWLGPNWIPGTPGWERMHNAHLKIYEKVVNHSE